jgi:uncharacterized protein (TIRG00374 family)
MRPEQHGRRTRIPHGRRALASLLTLGVTLVFSYVALDGVSLGRAWHALRTSDYAWLLPALLALALSMAARALRWRSLFAPGRRPPLGPVANAMLLGYLYNSILPARGGEVARVVVLSRRSEAQPVEIVGTAVTERLFDVLAILVIFFLSQPWLPRVSWLSTAAVMAGVLVAAIAACVVLLVRYGERPVRVLLAPLGRLPGVSGARVERAAGELVEGLSGLRQPAVAREGFLWSCVAWLLTAAMAYLVTLAFHLDVPFSAGVLVSVAVGLAMVLPAPPASVGIFEGAALIGLKAYGVPHSAALPYALVLHLVNFLPFIAAGVWLLHHNSRHVPARAAGDDAARGSLWQELPAAPQAAAVQLEAQQGAQRLQPVHD